MAKWAGADKKKLGVECNEPFCDKRFIGPGIVDTNIGPIVRCEEHGGPEQVMKDVEIIGAELVK